VLPSATIDVPRSAVTLLADGFVHLREHHATKDAAWAAACQVFAAASPSDAIGSAMPRLEVVGEFTVPPAGALRRDYQALHIDFGLPVDAREPVDVARFTALFIDAERPPTSAHTRVVPLAPLLRQRTWSDRAALLANLRAYGGAAQSGAGYIEGILGRLVEAADQASSLPPLADPDFLCGMEFASASEERTHFARHSLDIDAVEHRIVLLPGELLLFDNLATAHGRVGIRRPEELHQLCLGYRGLPVPGQRTLLDRVLGAFGAAGA
jgi:hypothetical protein